MSSQKIANYVKDNHQDFSSVNDFATFKSWVEANKNTIATSVLGGAVSGITSKAIQEAWEKAKARA